MIGEPGQVGIKHQQWPFWQPLLIYHVKDDKGDISHQIFQIPKIYTKYIFQIPNILLIYHVKDDKSDISYQIFS